MSGYKDTINNNTGEYNTGTCNTGNGNTGNCNTGESNAGNWNTGNCNTGNCNTGNCNTRNYNTGNYNIGNCNTRNYNTGNWNTGNCNTSNYNTGNWNTGDYNTGDRNTGDFNTGSFNTGYCNSITPDECFIFNKTGLRSDWEKAKIPDWMGVSLTIWVNSNKMSYDEKRRNPSYRTTGGYLKSYNSLAEAYKESWINTSEEDRELTRKLPNFSEEAFEKVFGFNPWGKRIIKIDIGGETVEISESSLNRAIKFLNELL